MSTPHAQTTYSVAIDAAPEAVWPWLVQMGYHRAGWYIDARWNEWINRYVWPNLVPENERAEFRPNADTIIPDLQSLEVGDEIPDGPPGTAAFSVVRLDPPWVLGLLSHTHIPYLTPAGLRDTKWQARGEFSWVFVLEPMLGGRTRLLIRTRARCEPAWLRRIVMPLFHVSDRLHARQMLDGIKRRAEALQLAGDQLTGVKRQWLEPAMG